MVLTPRRSKTMDCPRSPDGHACQSDVPKHWSHFAVLGTDADGLPERVYWEETPPPPSPKRQKGKATAEVMIGIIDQITNTEPRLMTRSDGPATSVESAKSASLRSGTQKRNVLEQYLLHPDGLIDDEAADLAGYSVAHGYYPRRSNDLRREGRIVDTGRT